MCLTDCEQLKRSIVRRTVGASCDEHESYLRSDRDKVCFQRFLTNTILTTFFIYSIDEAVDKQEHITREPCVKSDKYEARVTYALLGYKVDHSFMLKR